MANRSTRRDGKWKHSEARQGGSGTWKGLQALVALLLCATAYAGYRSIAPTLPHPTRELNQQLRSLQEGLATQVLPAGLDATIHQPQANGGEHSLFSDENGRCAGTIGTWCQRFLLRRAISSKVRCALLQCIRCVMRTDPTLFDQPRHGRVACCGMGSPSLFMALCALWARATPPLSSRAMLGFRGGTAMNAFESLYPPTAAPSRAVRSLH
jgi:hypothetical protein